MPFHRLWLSLILALAGASAAHAQERAYFVTYDHYLEEPGNLEIAMANTTGIPKGGHRAYWAPWLELEYGINGWWTAELYLEGVTTRQHGSAFTGWRWENRFRPLKSEHRLDPVFYVRSYGCGSGDPSIAYSRALTSIWPPRSRTSRHG